ncbi:MAG TPA: hypothetical protein VHE12_01495 [bacterium]|nr:hypothetical protein [bacterium]
MFLGHYAVGFAAKKWAPKVSLGSLLIGALFLDLLWPLFLLMDLEHVRVSPGITRMVPFDFYDYPLSHSLFMTIAWSLLVGLVYLVFTRDGRGSCILGGLVASHWFLDLLVHRPDLPIWPADSTNMAAPKVGLFIWNSMVGTLILEFGLLALGVWLYTMATKAKDRTGVLAFWGLVLFLAVMYVVDLRMTPPNNTNLLSLAGFSQLLMVAWGYWIDDHRKKA